MHISQILTALIRALTGESENDPAWRSVGRLLLGAGLLLLAVLLMHLLSTRHAAEKAKATAKAAAAASAAKASGRGGASAHSADPLVPNLSAAPTGPPMAWEPCRLPGVEHEARCGTLKRPLRPAGSMDGTSFELHVAVLPSLARQPLADPVLFLAGGPGQSAISLASTVNRWLGKLRHQRDLVLIDLRGTGQSAGLHCPEDFNDHPSLATLLAAEGQMAALQRCREQLQRLPHGDLRYYTTSIAMQDVEAVRQSLGVAQWNLVGVSYGTRAALDYLRQYPEHVRRMVLDGVMSPDMVLPATASASAEEAFEALLRHCEQIGSTCHKQFPALRAQWGQLLASVPREVVVAHPFTGRDERFLLSREGLAGLVRAPLYVPALAAGLPQAVSEAAQGRFAGLVGLAALSAVGGSDGRMSTGLYFSVVCSEDVPRLASVPDEVASGVGTHWGAGLRQQYQDICREWPRNPVQPVTRSLRASQAPVLLLSGDRDPVTPPRYAERVARALGDKAVARTVKNSGHGHLGLGCVGDLAQRFVQEPEEEIAMSLATEDKLCHFELPYPVAMLPLSRASAVAPAPQLNGGAP